jgi:hypothetical protein
MIINGKQYPLWSQFIERKDEFIGGILQEDDEKTVITDIVLVPNSESAFFEVKGENFSCGFDVGYGGIIGGDADWITFQGYGDHIWRVRSKQGEQP